MNALRVLTSTLVLAGLAGLVGCGNGREVANDTEAVATTEGERYRVVVVPEGLTWDEANARAEADGGHLVTIASAEENAEVYRLIADTPELWVDVDAKAMVEGQEIPIQVTLGPWIGLYQAPDSEEPSGGWTWVTGEPLDYRNWLVGSADETEPNDLGGVEDYGHFFARGLGASADTWNDMPNDPLTDFTEAGVEVIGGVNSPRGYIVEFE